ncbi:MAG: S8 family peptidase [Bacteroidetes bacterium]|nr:S8 family peptidase [Bacteroidota bacterium]MCL2301831.1 S8 family peptidase [Lentimicrobiaceae bacterium]
MGKIVSIVIFSFCLLNIQAQCDYYYWFDNNKICLDKYDKMRYILVNDEEDTFIVREKLEKMGYAISNFRKANYSYVPYHSAPIGDQYWTIIESSNSEDITTLDIDGIGYEASFFISFDVFTIGMSHTFVVRLNTPADTVLLDSMARVHGVTILGSWKLMPDWFTLSCSKMSTGNAMDMANLFHESNLFSHAQPNFFDYNIIPDSKILKRDEEQRLDRANKNIRKSNTETCVNDTYFEDQWGLHNTGQYGEEYSSIDIKYCMVKEIARGHPDIIVAVVDHGVEFDHPDLTNIYHLSYDAEEDESPSQIRGPHGVACAGIIGADANNGKGIAGIAPESPIMSISEVLFNSPDSYGKRAEGIKFAVNNGASIINNSWICSFLYRPLIDAIDSALTYGRNGKGCIVICISGNYETYPILLPNSYETITVGSISPCGERLSWTSCDSLSWASSYGELLDIMAPGVFIPTTDLRGPAGYNSEIPILPDDYSDQNYTKWFGMTSSAAPHVAGVAALVLSVNPNLTGKEVKNIIESTAQKVRTDLYDYDIVPDRPNGTWNEEMGHGLVDAYTAVLKALETRCYNGLPIVHGNITQNTIWSTPVYASASIAVLSGATLTIASQLECDQDVSITIHPGGKLIIDGGVLTNACENEMWQGITVLGDLTKPLTPQYQGCIQIDSGSIIENAVRGIHATDGGIVIVGEAHFVNNTTAVQIDPVETAQPGISATFTQTQFTINDNYLRNPLDFENHLKLSDSKRVTLSGCTFLNETSQTNHAYEKNTGIWAFNSPLIVQEYCPPSSPTGPNGECLYPIPSTFSGFNTAISASNSGKTPLLFIQGNEFSDNLYGVKLNTVDYANIVSNKFDLSLPGAYAYTYALGLYANQSTGYNITENTFTNTNNALQTTGIMINKSGSDENVVYKNNFTNLYIGVQATDKNSSQTFGQPLPPFVTGLQFQCNDFSGTVQADILVGYFPWQLQPWADNSVRRNQGSSRQPAGNKFFGRTSGQNQRIHVANYSNYDINYYYSNAMYEEPIAITSSVFKDQSSNLSHCPSQTGPHTKGRNLEDFLAQYDEWNAEYQNWLAKLLAFEGDNEEEYHEVLQMVSYYNALKENYFNLIIVSVSGMWYEVNGGEEAEKFLLLKEEKVADGDLSPDDGRGESTGKAGRGSLYENLRYLFEYRAHYTDYLSIIETYLAESNYEEALVTLAKMHKLFEVSEEQTLELKGLEFYTHWLQKIEREGSSIYTLSKIELEYLTKYVETNTGRGTVFANNILCELYRICMEEEVEGGKEKGEGNKEKEGEIDLRKSVSSAASACEKNALENVTIYPNPTTGELQVTSYELQIESIEILDVYGRKLSSNHLITSSSHHKIDLSYLNSGIYFVKVATNHGEVVKKVVKQ